MNKSTLKFRNQHVKSTFHANIHHAYSQTDGTYAFPNTREGDMLKTAKREIEELIHIISTYSSGKN
jgi:hypothetical protein